MIIWQEEATVTEEDERAPRKRLVCPRQIEDRRSLLALHTGDEPIPWNAAFHTSCTGRNDSASSTGTEIGRSRAERLPLCLASSSACGSTVNAQEHRRDNVQRSVAQSKAYSYNSSGDESCADDVSSDASVSDDDGSYVGSEQTSSECVSADPREQACDKGDTGAIADGDVVADGGRSVGTPAPCEEATSGPVNGLLFGRARSLQHQQDPRLVSENRPGPCECIDAEGGEDAEGEEASEEDHEELERKAHPTFEEWRAEKLSDGSLKDAIFGGEHKCRNVKDGQPCHVNLWGDVHTALSVLRKQRKPTLLRP